MVDRAPRIADARGGLPGGATATGRAPHIQTQSSEAGWMPISGITAYHPALLDSNKQVQGRFCRPCHAASPSRPLWASSSSSGDCAAGRTSASSSRWTSSSRARTRTSTPRPCWARTPRWSSRPRTAASGTSTASSPASACRARTTASTPTACACSPGCGSPRARAISRSSRTRPCPRSSRRCWARMASRWSRSSRAATAPGTTACSTTRATSSSCRG
ncbi:hypothetical protein ACAN107058_07140 [Paracidovorax anthurii]